MEWCLLVETYWNQCSHCADFAVPEWMPKQLWDRTFGSLRFLNIVMRRLHLALQDVEFEVHEISASLVNEIADAGLLSFKQLFGILSRINKSESWQTSEQERTTWGDYLPLECFTQL
ncbi:hypothetical protein D2917_07935 [Cupriavidus oxalaticus]|uniref:Uncharacterized protein n=2 Tax=Cupriavidus oxalaticus TaxID=96344 RepID=A0A5P3VCT2_9BURK|nr:hypothetical protein D2917_07935 [Cupriavidus oxalaticus]